MTNPQPEDILNSLAGEERQLALRLFDAAKRSMEFEEAIFNKEAFTVKRWVHCESHGAPHYVNEDGTCWCGCIETWPEVGPMGTRLHTVTYRLDADERQRVYAECRERDLWLFSSQA